MAPPHRTTASNSSRSFSAGIVLADLAVGDEGDALGRHQIDAALDDALVELHVGDAVHEQAADAVGALEDGDPVAGLVELGGGGKPGGAGADDGDLLAGAHRRRLGHDPAFLEALIDDGALDGLDRDRRLVDAEDARAFARRRADAAGELGEVVGLVQPFERFLPQAAIDEVVPLGDEVVDRAAGRPCLRAACRCGRTARRNPCSGRPACAASPRRRARGTRPSRGCAPPAAGQRQLARIFHETGRLTHRYNLESDCRARHSLPSNFVSLRLPAWMSGRPVHSRQPAHLPALPTASRVVRQPAPSSVFEFGKSQQQLSQVRSIDDILSASCCNGRPVARSLLFAINSGGVTTNTFLTRLAGGRSFALAERSDQMSIRPACAPDKCDSLVHPATAANVARRCRKR